MYWKHKLWHTPRHFQDGPANHIHVWPPVAAQWLCAPLPSTNSWWIPEVSLLRAKPREEKQEEGQRETESESKVSEVMWWKPNLANPLASRSQHPEIFDLVWKKKKQQKKSKGSFNRGKTCWHWWTTDGMCTQADSLPSSNTSQAVTAHLMVLEKPSSALNTRSALINTQTWQTLDDWLISNSNNK